MEKTDSTDIQVQAIVKSPSRYVDLRKGAGFSIGEIKAAGKTIQIIKELGIRIDYYRKSIHKSNIEQLKKVSSPKKKGKTKEPFVRKEKKIRIRSKKPKKKVKSKKVEKVKPKKSIKKETKPKKEAKKEEIPKQKIEKEEIPKQIIEKEEIPKQIIEKEEIPKQKIEKEEIPKQIIEKEEIPKQKIEKVKAPKEKEVTKGIPLTKLSGLGSTTEKKFKEVGVNNVEELIQETPEELAMLLSGVSKSRLKKWIEEGKNLLNQ